MQRKYNEAYLESACNDNAKFFERVPLTTWKGTAVQINDARTFARKPAASIKVEDIMDDRLVVELGKEGFIERIYKERWSKICRTVKESGHERFLHSQGGVRFAGSPRLC